MVIPSLNTTNWITKDGQSLTAKEMTDTHLQHLLYYLQSKQFLAWVRDQLDAASTEPADTEEYIDYFTGDMDNILFREHVRPSLLWRSLVSEADRRGLKHNLIL